MGIAELLFLGLGLLRTVLGAGLHTTLNTLRIQRTTDDVVTDTGKVLDTAAADQYYGVFLQVVADAGDVCGHFIAIGQANTGDLTQCGVGLLGSRGSYRGANASFLGGGQIGGSVLQGVHALTN